MNSAMPEKIGWSLTHDFDKPWVKAIKAKHFSCSTFMQCQKKKNCSNLWPTLLNTRNTLTKRLCYKVGRGNNVNMWEDHWIPNTPGFKPTPKSDEMTLKQRIVQSLKNHNGEWNTTLLNEMFSRESMQNIYVEFFGQIMKKRIGLYGWETRMTISLSNYFIGQEFGKVKSTSVVEKNVE